MSLHQLERRQVVCGDLSHVFGFFQDPRNLEAITPPWLRFEVVSSSDERVRRGSEIEYRLRWQGIPVRWRSCISEYKEGECFADEMVSGPYRSWYHRHLFRPVPGGSEMIDVVEYELPFGPLGRLVHTAIVRAQLEAIFDYREGAISRIFSASLGESGRRNDRPGEGVGTAVRDSTPPS